MCLREMIKIRKYIEDKINELSSDIIKSTQKLLQIKSVKDKAEKNMPLERNKRLPETTLNIAEKAGPENKNLDGYAGYAEIGEGNELIGILCHLDVVPEGRG